MANKKKTQGELSDSDLLDLYSAPASSPTVSGNGPDSAQYQDMLKARGQVQQGQANDFSLLDQFAPKPEEIAAYQKEALKQELLARQAQSQKPAEPKPGILANSKDDGDISGTAKNVTTATIKGASHIPGIFGDLYDTADYLSDRIAGAITGETQDQLRSRLKNEVDTGKNQPLAAMQGVRNRLYSGNDISQPILNVTGEYQPQTSAGKFGAAAIENAIPAIAMGNPSTSISRGVTGAGMGATGYGVTDLTGDPLAGMAAGMALPTTAGLVRGGTNALVGRISPERAALADAAINKYGIPLGVGQVSDSKFVNNLTDVNRKLPGGGGGGQYEQQKTTFNNAVASTFGESAPKITPELMAKARDRIGMQFDDVASQTPTIKIDGAFHNDLVNLMKNAKANPSDVAAPIREIASTVADAFDKKTGTMTGEQYQRLTKKGAFLDEAMQNRDPNIKNFALNLREKLDNLFERNASPQIVDQLKTARSQWSNLRTVEDLVAKADGGNLSPWLLQTQVNKNNKGTYGAAYGGGGDLKELANIGQSFLKPPPDSGTASRINAQNMISSAGVIGAGLLHAPLATGGALAAGAGGVATNRLMGSFLRSPNEAQRLVARSSGAPVDPGFIGTATSAAIPFFAQTGNNALMRSKSNSSANR